MPPGQLLSIDMFKKRKVDEMLITEDELRYALGDAFIKFSKSIPDMVDDNDKEVIKKLAMQFINDLLDELNIDKQKKINELSDSDDNDDKETR